MDGQVLAVVGTTLAALIAMGSAAYTARQSKQATVITAERAAEMSDRESQRAVQTRMLELLSTEVETLNRRVIDLRQRLQTAEDSVDLERSKRREVEQRMDELTDSVERLRNILGGLPVSAENPAVKEILQRINPRAT